jgi:peptide subunit release factor 1 (eRF1)
MEKKICASPDCGKEFIIKVPHAQYCSDKCRSREYKRKKYNERKKSGLCPQCGKEMKAETSRSYCDDCKEYFHGIYEEKKST